MVLPVLGGVIAALLGLALLASWRPVPRLAAITAGLSGLVLLGALVVTVAGDRAVLALPIGLGLLPATLALDPLGAWFLVALSICGVAQSGAAQPGEALSPALLGAGLLTVLAGDAGSALLGLAALALLSGARHGAAGILLLAGALVALSPGGEAGFAAIRLVPPEAWRAGLALGLLLAGLGSAALAWPWRLPPSALPVLPLTAAYLLCRLALDLPGAATPAWWGIPLMLLGAAIACIGALLGLRTATLPAAVAGLMASQTGWIMAGTGLVAVARSADLLPLATLAGGGTMLHVLTLALGGSLAQAAATAAMAGAGTASLDRLGGLATRMPAVAMAMLVAAASLALLPPGAGFAGAWMLLQAAFAAVRLGGVSLHLAVAAAAVLLAAAAGLSMAAAVRMGGLAFLGRPRTPRAAAAEDAAGRRRAVLLGLAGAGLAAGLLPGLLVRLAGPAQFVLTRAHPDGQAGWYGLLTQQGAPGYLPWVVALLLAAGYAALTLATRRLPGTRTVPAWEDGFAPPPPWLPFGEPATQATASAMAAVLPRTALRLPGMPRIVLRIETGWPPPHPAAVLLALAVALILAVLLLGPP